MNRNILKCLCVALALALLCGVVGCNAPSGGESTTTDSTTTTATTTGSTADGTEPSGDATTPSDSTAPSNSTTDTTASETESSADVTDSTASTTDTTATVTTKSTTVKTTVSGVKPTESTTESTTAKPTTASATTSATATTASTAASTTKSTTKSTTASTTKSTTKSTTASTTKSTTKSTTASTTKSTTKSTTASTTASTTVIKPKEAWEEKTSDIGFGFYAVIPTSLTDPDSGWTKMTKSNYVNTQFVASVEELAGLSDYNVKAWMYVNAIFSKVRNGDETWKSDFDALWDSVQKNGYADALLGWYLDEPWDMASLKAISQYATKYNKRFFCCFMVNTVDYNLYGGYKGDNYHINKDNIQYLTDVAAVHYWEVNASNKPMYQKLYKKLRETKADGAKMWYLPATFNYYDTITSSNTEIKRRGEAAVNHLKYMYEFLQDDNPEDRGGLLCFSYDHELAGEQLYGMNKINEKTGGKWDFVMDECIKIGKEICRGEWDE